MRKRHRTESRRKQTPCEKYIKFSKNNQTQCTIISFTTTENQCYCSYISVSSCAPMNVSLFHFFFLFPESQSYSRTKSFTFKHFTGKFASFNMLMHAF